MSKLNIDDVTHDAQILFAKSHLGSVAADLLSGGIHPAAIFAALGSVQGNILGMCMPQNLWEKTVDMAKGPTLADAERARIMKAGN